MPDTALITGASGGIGEELAKLIAAGGSNVVLLARSADKLQALANNLQRRHSISATTIVDLSRHDAVAAVIDILVQRAMTIDVLVNNAGFGTIGPFAAVDAGEQMRMLNVNVVALTALTRQLLPGMLQRGRGRVLNVASTAAFQPGPLMAVYCAFAQGLRVVAVGSAGQRN